jgi:hypothetical protein
MKARRIVFDLDPQSRRNAALEEIAGLAGELEAELVGLLVQDVELLQLASLPFAREVGFPSAARRGLDVERLERSFEVLATELRRGCEAALKGMSVSWSIRVARGSRIEQLLRAATEGDVPTLLILPGADLRAEATVVNRSELTEDGLRELLAGARRPILILP